MSYGENFHRLSAAMALYGGDAPRAEQPLLSARGGHRLLQATLESEHVTVGRCSRIRSPGAVTQKHQQLDAVLRRASLGVGQGRNKAAPTAARAGAPGIARALSSLGPGS